MKCSRSEPKNWTRPPRNYLAPGRAAEYKDNETGIYVIRMSHYSKLLGLANGIPDEEAELLLNAAPMHDIGKIGMPDRIL